MIHLGTEGRRWLLAALRELAQDRPRRFEDLLWLGFGDDWTAIRDALIREGDVRYDPHGQRPPVLTPIGEAMIDRLAAHKPAESAAA